MAKIGVLLVNLGTPDAPTTSAVRRYLAEFLSDPRVIEQPKWLWWLVLHGIILRFRPRKSAKAYQKIWTEQGSPLLVNSQALAERLEQAMPEDVIVAVGMRYGNPSIAKALMQLQNAKIEKLIILPLYPQYSATTTATTFDAIAKELKLWRNIPSIQFIRSYYDEPTYIEALATSVNQFWQHHGRPQRLLISFHGLPQRYIDKGDPYYQECLATASNLAKALQLSSEQWQICFQSRLGPAKWLQPYLDKTLEALAKSGVHSVQVVCPGFAVDCLETLEEVAEFNKDLFLHSGGQSFHYIPALNDSVQHIELVKKLISL